MLTKSKATQKSISYILNNLRLDDEIEMNIEYGKHWKDIVREQSKLYNLTIAKNNDKPICLYGIVPFENNIGIVVLLTTEELRKRENFISFFNEAKKEVAMWEKSYSIICNRVYKNNKSAIRWLKWLGFKFDNPLGLSENKSLFFYKGNLKDENRTTTDNRAVQRTQRATLQICIKMERYSKLCVNH